MLYRCHECRKTYNSEDVPVHRVIPKDPQKMQQVIASKLPYLLTCDPCLRELIKDIRTFSKTVISDDLRLGI